MALSNYDVGLVSEVRTRIEIPDWHQLESRSDNPVFEGCVFDRTVGFRLSGFDFVAPVTPSRQSYRVCILRVRTTGAKRTTLPLIVEDCKLRWNATENWNDRPKVVRPEQLLSVQIIATRNSSPVYLQRCYLEDCVDLSADAPAVVSKNVIVAKHSHRGLSIPPSVGQTILVENNFVFAKIALQSGFRDADNFYVLHEVFAHPSYRFIGNYLEGEVGISVRPPNMDAKDFLVPHAIVERNIFHAHVGVHFTSSTDAAIAASEWRHGQNVFVGRQAEMLPEGLPIASSDIEHDSVELMQPALPDTSGLRNLLDELNADRNSTNKFGPSLDPDSESADWLTEVLVR